MRWRYGKPIIAVSSRYKHNWYVCAWQPELASPEPFHLAAIQNLIFFKGRLRAGRARLEDPLGDVFDDFTRNVARPHVLGGGARAFSGNHQVVESRIKFEGNVRA